ncbi:zf-RVT domain-containing protein, partial [Cephalotus follicularis]
NNYSWSWRHILNSRKHLANKMFYEVGDGQSFSLWFDPWFRGVPLVDRYGERVILDSGIQRNARLSSVIKEGEWDWKLTSPDLIEISILTKGSPISHTPDRIHWLKKGGTFKMRDACNTNKNRNREVEWWKMVWFPNSIPKHSFCVWLTFWESHKTLDKLLRWGLVSTSNC